MPIWVRREKERELQEGAKPALPWGLYLLGSTFTGVNSQECVDKDVGSQ